MESYKGDNMEKKKVTDRPTIKAKPKKTDELIKVSNKLLILEQKVQSIESALKLALTRMGLHKEYPNG
jgi:hypothetical protein